MVNLAGNAAFSVVLAAAGLSPFYGDWPEPSAPDASFEQAVAMPAPVVAPVAEPELPSADVPNLYEEIGGNHAVTHEDMVHGFGRQLEMAFGINSVRANNFSDWILTAVESTSIPKEILAAVVDAESDFRYKVRSHAGAVGPAQVIPHFWQDACVGDIENDPKTNIQCGVVVLSDYLEGCGGDMVCALQTYNVGPTNMRNPKYAGAKQRYINKIRARLARLNGVTLLASK